jgi:hypothetical protein
VDKLSNRKMISKVIPSTSIGWKAWSVEEVEEEIDEESSGWKV